MKKGPIRIPRDRDRLLAMFRSRLTGRRGELAQIAKIMGVYAHHVGNYAEGRITPHLHQAKRLIEAQEEYLARPYVVRNPLGCVQTIAATDEEHQALSKFKPVMEMRMRHANYHTIGGKLWSRPYPRTNARTIPVSEYIELLKQHYKP